MRKGSRPNNVLSAIKLVFQVHSIKELNHWSFQVGDLVLAVQRPIIITHRIGNKFTSKWDGPYVVQEVYTNGAYKLIDNDGVRIGPINGKFLKCFYAWKSRIAPRQELKLPAVALQEYMMSFHYPS